MPHPALVEAARPVAGKHDVRDLLVLWQHPESRAIQPIGRLSHTGAGYSFAYVAATRTIDDFRPLVGLPDQSRRYDSDELPPVFYQRVMSPRRPDFDDFADLLGLTHGQATPWEQIVRSGGERAGDSLQFMELPLVEERVACARFLVNGIRHIPGQSMILGGRQVIVTSEQQEAALQQLRPGDRLAVRAEEDNPQDPCATVVTAGGTPIGYVPQVLSAPVRELLGSTTKIDLTVVRANGPRTPPHLRLAVDLRAAMPPEFSFDPEGQWEPLAR